MAAITLQGAARTAVLGAIAALVCVLLPAVSAAKTPGTVHCYGGFCHRINSVDEMDAMVGRRGVLKASYYDDCKRDRFNPCGLTSSGAVFRPDRPDNAASPIFPDGTVLLTYNPQTRLAAVLRVTSAGPYRDDRTLDVSRATAEHLGFLKQGVATLEVVVLKSPEEHEARYKKLRDYAPVPGFLGLFDTFEKAHDTALARMQLNGARVTVAAIDTKSDIDRYWPRGLAMDVVPSSYAVETQAYDSAHGRGGARVPERVLQDFGPQAGVRALEVGESSDADDNAISRWAAPDLVDSGIIDRLWSFFVSVRERARLRSLDDEFDRERAPPERG